MKMAEAIFRFCGGLDYFLGPEPPGDAVVYAFREEKDGKVAVKHAVESLGVPHTEVDRIAANGQVVGFGYGLSAGDVVEVCALTPKPDQVNLRPRLPRPVRFVVDTHLGRLAVYLRLLGFDARYRNDYSDARLAELSQQEGRVLLTRDRGLLKRRIVDFGCCVRENDPKQQLVSLLHRYALAAAIAPWRRCLRCNEVLEVVAKAEIIDQLEPKTQRYYDDFRRCPGCGQIYWPGSHYERMQLFIEEVGAALRRADGSM
jgi:uncharacterized protein with PIN domain